MRRNIRVPWKRRDKTDRERAVPSISEQAIDRVRAWAERLAICDQAERVVTARELLPLPIITEILELAETGREASEIAELLWSLFEAAEDAIQH